MGLLDRTRTYLIGNMEYGDDNEGWREEVEEKLSKLGVICFNPYDHPFIHRIDEGQKDSLKQLREKGEWDELERRMKDVGRYDLSAVDRSDFIICYLKPELPTFGTMHELVQAKISKRPVFLCVEGGKAAAPFWAFFLVPHQYMYSSMDEVVDTIEKMDAGTVPMDSDRWRLMKPEYR